MTVTAVLGAQWGDEGKGAATDRLAKHSTMVIRANGGNNAGHTIINEYGEFKLHLVPAGIFNPETQCIIGPGTVVNLVSLLEELRELRARGVMADNLRISTKAHLVMPWHIWQDQAEEARRNPNAKIGTTSRGMGPVYSDKAARKGLRVEDLLDFDRFSERFREIYEEKMRLLTYEHGMFTLALSLPSAILGQMKLLLPEVLPFIADTDPIVEEALKERKNILIEGAQGFLLDIDYGTYPYVTSSNCGIAGLANGSAIPPASITERIAVVKAYTTRVGRGPFPTQAALPNDRMLRERGREYGATTGRPRSCGWLDLPLLRYAASHNGFTGLVITKLDVLSGLEHIPVGTHYLCSEHTSCQEFSCVQAGKSAVYEVVSGWREDLSNMRQYEELPPNARAYIRRIEEAMGAPAKYISVGPKRDQMIIRK